MRAERHADADLVCPLAHGVSHNSVQTDGRQQQRKQAEEAGDSANQAFLYEGLINLCGKRFDIEERQIGVNFPRRLSNGCDDAGRVSRSPDLEGRPTPAIRILKVRNIVRTQRRFAQAFVLRILDYSDDFDLAAGFRAEAKAPANRIFVAKVVARESLVDDGDARRILVILRGQAPPSQNRHSYGFKILRPYFAEERHIPVP